MADFLLSDHTAVLVSLGYSCPAGNVVKASSLWALSLRRQDVSSAVLPLDLWFRRSSSNLTLQQQPILHVIKCFDVWLWACTCEHHINKSMLRTATAINIQKGVLCLTVNDWGCGINCVCVRNEPRQTEKQTEFGLHKPSSVW